MIRKLCEARQLPREGELRAFAGDGGASEIALCVGVVDGVAYAVDNVCPHARAPLAGGHVSGDDVVCPLHGWRWNLRTGEPVRVGDPPIQTYEVRQYGTEVFVRIPADKRFRESTENKV